MNRPSIPLARPNVTQAEIDAVVAVLSTPQLSLGPKVSEFESDMAQYCGTREAVACSNGTAALHMMLEAAGVSEGHEVITTPFSFISSANCALLAGAKPVFVDIDPDTWNIDPGLIEAAVNPRSRAVIPVDVFGVAADMDSINEIARRCGLYVIEDSCEALGSSYKGRRAGSLGDAGAFGFYPNKQITTGEGGMIVTDDTALAGMCRSLRNQGRSADGGWLAHPRLGYNYRLCDINCAMGIVQLSRIDEIKSHRVRVYGLYHERLSGEQRVSMQKVTPGAEDVNWFVMVVRLADEYDQSERDRILIELRNRGIGCSNYFAPIHLQPFYVERFGYKEGDFPVCEALTSRSIALPFHHELTEKEVDIVCQELQRLLGESK